MNKTKKILVGGAALREMGSSRHTDDADYLVWDETTDEYFISTSGGDMLNGAAFPFFGEVYKMNTSETTSPQALLELKCYAFSEHCWLGAFQKADNDEYDIKFLVRKYNLRKTYIAQKYLPAGAMTEIQKIINSTKTNNQEV